MIPYLGNKSNLSGFIVPNLPNSFDRWVEPFGGSFGLYFTLNLSKYPGCEFIYNDCNRLNSNLFSSLKKSNFLDMIANTIVTKDVFLSSFDKITSSSKLDSALSWLIILCCSNNKKIMDKEYIGNSGFERAKSKIPHYLDYFDRMIVHSMDYTKIMRKYDSESSFFYVDPPYVGYEDYYINSKFAPKSHFDLSKLLLSLSGKWCLSYYLTDSIGNLYSNFTMKSISSGLATETIIMNY